MTFRPMMTSWLVFFHLILSGATFAQFNPDAATIDGKQDLDIQPTDVIIWTPVQANLVETKTVEVGLRLQTRNNFSIYKDKLKITAPSGFALAGAQYPASKTQQDPMSDSLVEVYQGGDFFLTFEGLEAVTAKEFKIDITFLGCTELICLFPYTQSFSIPIQVDPSKISSEVKAAEVLPPPVEDKGAVLRKDLSGLNFQDRLAAQLESGELGLTWLLIAVFAGGLLTNLTPCVFPMIPITVRLLGGQQGKKLPSILYATGIIATYTAIGTAVSLTGGLFGSFLGSTAFNVGFGLLFVLLALNMLGFGNMSSLQNLGTKLGSKNSTLNHLLMGAGAGLVAAPCTGPILGALFVFSTQLNDALASFSLFFLYSVGFGLPYIFLGMAAGKVSKIQISPKFQVAVKLSFAAIMVTLALYYLKNPTYMFLQNFNGMWFKIAVSLIAVGSVVALVSLNSDRLINNKSALLIPTAILGFGLFAGVQYLSGSDLEYKVNWYKTEEAAYLAAKQEGKPILVDGWADWCQACKEMDATTFQDDRLVRYLSENWILLKLDMTEYNDETEALGEKYGMPGLPTIVLVPQDGNLDKSVKLTGYKSSDILLKETKTFLER